MLGKHSFKNPKNWAALTSQEVLENMHYLQRYHGVYKIKKVDSKTIKIGNVLIYSDAIKTPQGVTRFATVKGKTICDKVHPQVYEAIDKLYHDAERSIKPFGEKVKDMILFCFANGRTK